MKADAAVPGAKEAASVGIGSQSTQYTPRLVAELGARFVPQTLRYLGVPEGTLLDAAQDVFLIALRRLDEFEGRSTLTTWLYGISVRVAHNYRRRNQSSRELLVEELPELGAAAQQESSVEQGEWRRTLSALLDQLDEGQRAAFVLFEIQQLSMKEVADALGCPLQTAYSRHKSAQARVLEAFKRHTAEGEA
jgi:RNA polymerase sigma-70 factor (ECF subfamily)